MVVLWADEPKEDQTADGGETLVFKAIFCKKKKHFVGDEDRNILGFDCGVPM